MSCASPVTIGSTYRWTPLDSTGTRVGFRKDDVIWDLTGATVSILFEDPGGNVSTFTATVDDATNGKAYYDNLTTLFDEAGVWTRTWKVVQGSITILYDPIEFTVVASP